MSKKTVKTEADKVRAARIKVCAVLEAASKGMGAQDEIEFDINVLASYLGIRARGQSANGLKRILEEFESRVRYVCALAGKVEAALTETRPEGPRGVQ